MATAKKATTKQAAHADNAAPLLAVLESAGPRPADTVRPGIKKNYSAILSSKLAELIAGRLKDRHPRVFPDADVKKDEEEIQLANGKAKKVDVVYAPPKRGLVLNVSIKTLNFADFAKRSKFYTHNITRVIGQELLVEARDCHDTAPYAVVIPAVFLPHYACFDATPRPRAGVEGDCSSFAEYAHRLADLTGRGDPRDTRQDHRFDAAFVAAYFTEAVPQLEAERGTVWFLDVSKSPPRDGLPLRDNLLTLDGFLDAVAQVVRERRNRGRVWGDSRPLPDGVTKQDLMPKKVE